MFICDSEAEKIWHKSKQQFFLNTLTQPFYKNRNIHTELGI